MTNSRRARNAFAGLPARWSLLPGVAALPILMAFATDVISDVVLDDAYTALGLTALALAAISMAGAVLTTHASRLEAD